MKVCVGDSRFTFGFIGTFGYWHGIEVLEKLIPAVIACEQSAHFLLLGDGPGKKLLEDLLCEKKLLQHVTFTGTLLPSIVPSYLAECDVFLCPTQPNHDGSRFFGSPTKLFEYLSMGKPVIASDLEQVAEIVSPAVRLPKNSVQYPLIVTDEVGFLVDPSDIQGFIDACVYLSAMPQEQRERMGRNARRKAVNQYTWRSHVQKIIDFAHL